MSLESHMLANQMEKDREASKEALNRLVIKLQERLGFRFTREDIGYIFEPYKKAIGKEDSQS